LKLLALKVDSLELIRRGKKNVCMEKGDIVF
jgi:hypothetical protein